MSLLTWTMVVAMSDDLQWDPDRMDAFQDVWSSEKLVELQSMQQGLHSEAKEAEMSLGILTVKGLSVFLHI